ncbi:TolC family protein [Planctomycetales bacterium ZRK34]|nr:TolC family protein [Planctomycetales bacterium ZRK34]
MHDNWRIGLVIMAAATLAGCSAGPLDDDPFAPWTGPDAHLQSLKQRLTPQVGPVADHETVEAEPLDIATESSPDALVELALQRNPDIRAAKQRVARLAERVPQARSLDDPMFQVAPFGEMAETAAGQVGLMTGVSQKLPTPGKLQTRGRIAAQETAAAVQQLQSVALTVIADVRAAWWSHYFTTRAIEVTEANRDLVAQFRDNAEARLRAGTAVQQDVLRASVELSNLDNELLTLHQRKTTAIAMINQLIDRPVTAPLPDPQVVELAQIDLQLDQLLQLAARENPEIRQVHERIEANRQRVKLAQLNRWPDLTLSANYSAVEDEGLSPVADGADQWWFGFGFNLPVWTAKLDAAEREARRGVLESLATLNSAHNRVAFRVQDALVRVQTQQRLVILFRDVIVPQARQAVDASLSGYRAGKLEFLTLIDNWRKMLNFQLMYHQSLAQLEKDFAELQRAVGQDVQRQSESADAPVPPQAGDHRPVQENSP